ncbi:hypothetical protein LWI29_026738 [Acer saccharum]|uniref:Uncharacterized protein n=1 Tax=Acer saccharum TaxID=4024 RepID=A0AA39SK76_ACESA|nr:hypothetical protein LWI29_026738 [Acer saccharum]
MGIYRRFLAIATSGEKLDAWNGQKRQKQRLNINKNMEILKEANAKDVNYNWNYIRKIKNKLDNALTIEENYWRQRAKADWMTKGDRNSRYFLAKASGRRARNRMRGLMDDSGVWKDSKDELVQITYNYFTGLFSSSHPSTQDLDKISRNVKAKLSEHMVCLQYTEATNYQCCLP